MSAVLAARDHVFSPRRQDFVIRPVPGAAGGLGAEVVGLDLSRPLSRDDFERLQSAHWEHHVLVFRDQRITPSEQVAFSRLWGPLQIHVLRQFQLPGHPEILQVSNLRDEQGQPLGLGDAGQLWHSDLSYKEKPSLGSLLHAQELPEEGGDTLFADQHAAYEALPGTLKQRLAGLQAEHSYLLHYEALRSKSPWRPALTQAQIAEVRPAVHPVVHTHPGNGRKALFVSEHFTSRILGLSEGESRTLLQQLFAHSVQPQFVYRHQWQPHDMVFWDNRAVLHLAAGTPSHLRRKLYRTTVEGARPVA
ncbi:TauD/TfdA dioxygenase family protein [Comamonas composti]|uniref:TauD/TfdA dioxygenase family protein n=1 Tax=Comamonas composti TaxID=408558 RepID=UPI00040C44A5|nr:TauD/TfdA family dioxygenase [Comamonas composti]